VLYLQFCTIDSVFVSVQC